MKIHLDEANNSFVVPLKSVKTRTKAQQQLLKTLIKSGSLKDAVAYLESFSGRRQWGVNAVKKRVEGIDRLSLKKKDSIKKLFDRMLDTSDSHRPYKDDQDFIGVEVECFIPFKSVRADENSRDCEECYGRGHYISTDFEMRNGREVEVETEITCSACDGTGRSEGPSDDSISQAHTKLSQVFKKNSIKFASIKDDGSIRTRDGYFPVEITILSRLSNPENLFKTCELLKTLGARVNKSCGLHVHLDARHLTTVDVKAIGRKFTRVMPLLTRMVPKSRLENQYCRPEVSKIGGGRYFAVNLTSFRKYKTIEIRLHSSTTSFEKIYNWAKLLSKIMTAEKIKGTVHEINQLTESIYLDEQSIEYFSQRVALFNPTANDLNPIANNALDNDEVA